MEPAGAISRWIDVAGMSGLPGRISRSRVADVAGGPKDQGWAGPPPPWPHGRPGPMAAAMAVEVGLPQVPGAEHLVLDVGGGHPCSINALRTACMNGIGPAQVVPGVVGEGHVGEVHQPGMHPVDRFVAGGGLPRIPDVQRRRSGDGCYALAASRGGWPAAAVARRQHPHAGATAAVELRLSGTPSSAPATPASGCAGGSSSRPASTTSSGPSTAGSTAR